MALRYADFGYILENGRVVMEGAAKELANNEDVKEFYLGISSGERKSFREAKHYRRRKRWLAWACRVGLGQAGARVFLTRADLRTGRPRCGLLAHGARAVCGRLSSRRPGAQQLSRIT
jgi:hypothetical protein